MQNQMRIEHKKFSKILKSMDNPDINLCVSSFCFVWCKDVISDLNSCSLQLKNNILKFMYIHTNNVETR